MKEVRISDVTMKRAFASKALTLSFKEKLEVVKQLDRIGVSVIEVEGIEKAKADSLRIKSIAPLVTTGILAVPVQMNDENIQQVWAALKDAKNPRLQIEAAVSPARMEYVFKKKAPALLNDVAEYVAKCRELCEDVEFVCDDATRADADYLRTIIGKAIEAGATTITICDDAGTMMPEEFAQFLTDLINDVPQLKDINLAVSCSNELYMSNATSVAAVMAGASEVKATSYPMGMTSLDRIAKIFASKADACQIDCPIRVTEINRAMGKISRLCEQEHTKSSLFSTSKGIDESIVLTAQDDIEAVMQCVDRLGYSLSDEDAAAVYESFQTIASKKETVTSLELDAIVASAALQVPPTYVLDTYVVTSGNTIKATAHVRLTKNGEAIDAVTLGDGPIDAALLAIDEIVGQKYELDDFQLQSVTEGQEAMGEAIVKLEHEGKIYSGRGISTDIVGSTIRAYINAVNKIVYEG